MNPNKLYSFSDLFKVEKVYDIEERWDKKRSSIQELSNNIRSLRTNVYMDLSSDNEKEALTALVIAIMDKTGERVGNGESADNGHYGITGLRKNHVTVIGNKILLEYTGKSGVDQTKGFSDERIAKALKKAIKNSPSKNVFETSDGFKVKADRINRYLDQFNISAKDIRGYAVNNLLLRKLSSKEIPESENARKKLFLSALKSVARIIGHGAGTLRKHYMIPNLDTEYIVNGRIIDIKSVGGKI